MRGMFLLEFKPTEFVVESSLRHKSKKNGLLCVQKCLKNLIYLAVNFLIFSQNYLHIYVMLFWTKGRLTWSKIETFYLFFRDSATQMALCCAARGWLCLTRHDSPLCIAFVCVANVCLSRKFGREQKGKMKRGGGGGDTRRSRNNSIGNACCAGYIIITERIWYAMQFPGGVPNITNFFMWLFFSGSSHQSLECHTCYSEKSWGECHRNAKVNKCPSFLNTCMKVHRTTRYPGGKAVHQFAKSCFARDMCKMSSCEQRATNESHVTCQDLSCCSTPLCNYG